MKNLLLRYLVATIIASVFVVGIYYLCIMMAYLYISHPYYIAYVIIVLLFILLVFLVAGMLDK